jgi:hypothetical protein
MLYFSILLHCIDLIALSNKGTVNDVALGAKTRKPEATLFFMILHRRGACEIVVAYFLKLNN